MVGLDGHRQPFDPPTLVPPGARAGHAPGRTVGRAVAALQTAEERLDVMGTFKGTALAIMIALTVVLVLWW